jgi:carbonic anhydrase
VHQFHFHAPSEHRINGVLYDAELHIVHSKFDESESESQYAVIAILFDSKKDIESGLLDRLRLQTMKMTTAGLLPMTVQNAIN